MKIYNKFLYIVAICGMLATSSVLTSCEDDAPVGDGTFTIDGIDSENGDAIVLNVSKDGYGYNSNKNGLLTSACYTYTIRTEGHWKIIPKSEDVSWIRFIATEGDNASKFFFGVWPNEGFDTRTADFSISIDGKEYPGTFIHIEQAPTLPTFSLTNGTLYSIPDNGGSTTIDVTTNTGAVEYSIEYENPADGEWLKYNSKNSKAASLVFDADANKGAEERKAFVTISSKVRPELKATATVVQNTYMMIMFDTFSYLNYTTSQTIWLGTGQKAIEQWTGDALTSNPGWVGMLNGSQTISRTYGRKGYILLGNDGRIGTVASPEFTKIGEGTADVNVTFDCVGYVAESGTRDYSDLYIGVWGEGTIAEANEDLTVNYKQLGGTKTLRVYHLEVTNFPNQPAGIFPAGYDEWASGNAQLKFRVNGVNAQTRVILMGGYWEDQRTKNVFDSPDPVQNGITYRRNNKNNRLGIDNFKVVRITK